MNIFQFVNVLLSNVRMALNPYKHAKRIGVKLAPDAHLLGKSNWGTEPWLISIGSKTRISKDVTFWNHDGAISVAKNMSLKWSKIVKFGYISIGNNCFVGANTTILMNVSVGDNSIIGACSLVTKDIPSGEVWGGVPAHYICKIEEYAEKCLLALDGIDIEAKDKRELSVAVADKYRNKKRKEK